VSLLGGAVLALAWAAGCGDDPTLRLRLEYDPPDAMDPVDNKCFANPCFSADACPLDCGGEVGLWVVDADDPTLILDSVCQEFSSQPSRKLRSLTEILADTTFKRVDAGRDVVVEIAVYAPKSEKGNCPRMDQSGNGAIETLPAYFGQSQRTRVRDGLTEINVPLTCMLINPQCSGTQLHMIAQSFDVSSLLEGLQPPNEFDFHAVQVFPFPGGAAVSLGAGLMHDTDATTWSATVPPMIIGEECPGTLVTRLGASPTPVLSCEGTITAFDTNTGEPTELRTTGYYVDKTQVNAILAALGRATVPPTGMLVGRVVESFPGGATPVAGAVVTPVSGTASVVYLTDNFDGTFTAGGAMTTGEGWFVIVDPPQFDDLSGMFGPVGCCNYLQASTGTGFSSTCGRVGVVDELVMATVIDMTGALCPAPP
jgi:hypothetical protein